jgi:hypothetical protein
MILQERKFLLKLDLIIIACYPGRGPPHYNL